MILISISKFPFHLYLPNISFFTPLNSLVLWHFKHAHTILYSMKDNLALLTQDTNPFIAWLISIIFSSPSYIFCVQSLLFYSQLCCLLMIVSAGLDAIHLAPILFNIHVEKVNSCAITSRAAQYVHSFRNVSNLTSLVPPYLSHCSASPCHTPPHTFYCCMSQSSPEKQWQ